MAKDPQAVAAKWSTNLSAATASITSGVQGVTVAPGQAAARQKAVWLQNIQASADRWAARTSAVPLSAWQQDMIQKGIPRIAAGAQGAVPKMAQFMTSFLPHVEAGRSALPARGNLEQNIARMTAMVRHNAAYKRPAGGM